MDATDLYMFGPIVSKANMERGLDSLNGLDGRGIYPKISGLF